MAKDNETSVVTPTRVAAAEASKRAGRTALAASVVVALFMLFLALSS